MKGNKHIQSFNEQQENLNISDVRRSFSFTYDDLKTAFEEGGENTVYDDMYGYSSSETFEEWFEKWFKKNYV
jgi:hypothetical protein